MKRFVVGLLAIFGALAVLAVGVVGIVAVVSVLAKPSVPDHVLLELKLDGPVVEYLPADPFARAMMRNAVVVRDVVDALERGAKDRRVVGVVANLSGASMGLAQIQELRDAVAAFRKAGKPAFAYADTFGEFGPGNGSYYLATAFDEIYIQPAGDVGLTGLIYETPFIRGTLDKLDVVPRMDHRYQYKNAMNTFTETKYTEPHREAMTALMESQFAQIVAGISEGRGIAADEVRGEIDRGPFLGQQAVEAHLVDGLKYRDEVLAHVREKAGKDAKLLYHGPYLERAGRPHAEGEEIALVYGVGAVQRGRGGYDPLSGSFVLGADEVAAALRDAIDDPSIKAIVFRVDSPGGSYVGSDTVWRETARAREAGKPVIVTMGNLAGSGGYFVAMAADKIVAEPGTITASIGVLGGKLVTTGLWSKLGVTFDEVHAGEHATMWSSTEDYDPSEWKKFEGWLDRVYADFTSRVAEGRRMDRERVLEIARGRIWSGEDAKRLGLVDALGGFPEAIRLAKEAAGIPDDKDVRIRVFPKPKSPFEELFSSGPDSSEGAAVRVMAGALERLRPVWVAAERIGLAPRDRGVLSMPEAVPGR